MSFNFQTMSDDDILAMANRLLRQNDRQHDNFGADGCDELDTSLERSLADLAAASLKHVILLRNEMRLSHSKLTAKMLTIEKYAQKLSTDMSVFCEDFNSTKRELNSKYKELVSFEEMFSQKLEAVKQLYGEYFSTVEKLLLKNNYDGDQAILPESLGVDL